MAAIDLTPAQVTTEIGLTRSEAKPPLAAPPLDTNGVTITFYRSDVAPNPMRAVVQWPGRDGGVDLLVNTAIPVADRAALRTALGRLLIAAREAVGAT